MARIKQSRKEATEASVRVLRAKRDLELKRLYIPKQPIEDCPEIPRDLTELNDAELMELMALTTAWQNYAAGQLAIAQVIEKFEESILEKLEAANTVKNHGDKTVALSKARAFQEEEYLEARENVANAFAYRKMVEVPHTSMEKCAFLLSRELSRRLGRNER